MTTSSRARWMLIVSMIAFGTIAPFVRNIGLPSAEVALYRAVIATVMIGVFLLAARQLPKWQDIKKALPLLLLSGGAMGFNWILLFEAYRYTTVSIATLSYYFAPVIVMIACPILFKERIGAKQWVCFAMSTVGIVLITGIGDLQQGSSHIIGILFGLGAATLYATVVLLNKFIRQITGIHRTFLQFIAAVIVLLPYVIFTGGTHLSSLSGIGIPCLLTVGIVHTGITYCLYFSSLKELPGQKAAILSYIDPLVAIIISVVFLKETITLTQITGGVLILGFTLYNEWSSQK